MCLINAYVNGDHELQVREYLAARLPGVRIELSHEVAPELREFERGSTRRPARTSPHPSSGICDR